VRLAFRSVSPRRPTTMGCCAFISTVVCFLAAAPAQPTPTVDVTGGAVRGYMAAPGAVFKAIPFADPPIAGLRWREPQPVKPWRGVRDASRYSPACMQNPLGTGVFLGPLARRYGVNFPTPQWDISEDCLYLNIWTPQWPVTEPHAVMFWMHGGSNRIGSGGEPGYDGAELAKHGVLVVTINYRLGPLGFFAHPDLTRESPHRSSGNYGLLDQIAALQWVRDNIAKFGGDPARVTVFGESAGAIDAGMLICSPLARGLFARAIMESGPVLGLAYAHSLREAERFGERVATLALRGHAGDPGGDSYMRRLRSLPAQAILTAAAEAAKQGPNPEFVLDGWVLQRTPQAVFASGTQQPVGMLIGNNGREASVFRGASAAPLAVDQGPKKTLHISFGNLAAVAIAAYVIDTHTGRSAAADDWLNDALMACPSAAMATLNEADGRPSFFYQFRRSIPGKGESELGSFHSLELPYVFGALHQASWNWLPFQKLDQDLAAAIQGYWTNFAKTGDPNGGGLPQWRPYTTGADWYMEFGNDGRAHPRQGGRPTFCELDIPKLKQRLLDNQ
jgi:para-nitrobenzyl esterase